MIQIYSVIRFDLNTISSIWITSSYLNQNFSLNLTHNIKLNLTQLFWFNLNMLFYLIWHTLHAFDSLFHIELSYYNLIWIINFYPIFLIIYDWIIFSFLTFYVYYYIHSIHHFWFKSYFMINFYLALLIQLDSFFCSYFTTTAHISFSIQIIIPYLLALCKSSPMRNSDKNVIFFIILEVGGSIYLF